MIHMIISLAEAVQLKALKSILCEAVEEPSFLQKLRPSLVLRASEWYQGHQPFILLPCGICREELWIIYFFVLLIECFRKRKQPNGYVGKLINDHLMRNMC